MNKKNLKNKNNQLNKWMILIIKKLGSWNLRLNYRRKNKDKKN